MGVPMQMISFTAFKNSKPYNMITRMCRLFGEKKTLEQKFTMHMVGCTGGTGAGNVNIVVYDPTSRFEKTSVVPEFFCGWNRYEYINTALKEPPSQTNEYVIDWNKTRQFVTEAK
jgi:hypothetical protein